MAVLLAFVVNSCKKPSEATASPLDVKETQLKQVEADMRGKVQVMGTFTPLEKDAVKPFTLKYERNKSW